MGLVLLCCALTVIVVKVVTLCAMQASGPRELILDGANGVGALKVPMLTEALGDLLKIDLRNTGQAKGDVLNFECGADFVFVLTAVPFRSTLALTIDA